MDTFIKAYDSFAIHLKEQLKNPNLVQQNERETETVVKTGLPYHWMNIVRSIHHEKLEEKGNPSILDAWFSFLLHNFFIEHGRLVPFNLFVPGKYRNMIQFFEDNLKNYELTRECRFVLHCPIGNLSQTVTSRIESEKEEAHPSLPVTMEKVNNDEKMQRYVEALAKGFNFPSCRELVHFYQQFDYERGYFSRFVALNQERQGVGTCCIYYPPDLPAIALIIEESTVPEERHKGISTALLDECVKDAELRGRKDIFIESNEIAFPLHKELGFRSVGEFFLFKMIVHPRFRT